MHETQVRAAVPYFPTLELCNGMVGVSSKKMRSVKAINKVVRFDYRKVKCNSLLVRYTFAKVCESLQRKKEFPVFHIQSTDRACMYSDYDLLMICYEVQ